MSNLIEVLKARVADAQTRLQKSQQALIEAQKEHEAALKEFSTWQAALEIEGRKADDFTGIAATPEPVTHDQTASSLSKAELIRNVLRQNPAGVTPANIWRAVRDKVKHRPYVYSVLTRLKQKNAVTVKRGKYFLLPTPDEQEEQVEPRLQ